MKNKSFIIKDSNYKDYAPILFNTKELGPKISVTKIAALVLCIVTISLSLSIYSNYKELYSIEHDSKNPVFYTALAQISDTNSIISETRNKASILNNLNKSRNEKDKSDIQKNILLKILILFASFVSLATIQNIAFKVESNSKEGAK